MKLHWMAALRTAALGLVVGVGLGACGGSDDPTPIAAPAPTAQTLSGTVEGSLHSSGSMKQFLGIPYAAPPVGALRWAAPTAPAGWAGVRSAKQYGTHCPQRDTSPLSFYGTAAGSEDCLYLNVFTPTTPGPHPVLVWIHGGAFQYGRGVGYTPVRLTAQGVVVVSINYRLGALGFLSHPALNVNGRSGNYGVMDQTFALHWVKNNISAFGGDPSNITIAGQSAGAASVLTQLNSPAAVNLFHKAVLQSGPVTEQPTLAEAQFGRAAAPGVTPIVGGVDVATTRFSCPNDANAATCLRGLSVDAIIANQPSDTFSATNSPVVDGVYLLRGNQAAVNGNLLSSKVPVLIGATTDEYTSLLASEETAANNAGLAAGSPVSALKPVTDPTYVPILADDAALTTRLVRTFGPTAAPTIAAAYPASAYGGSRPLALSAAVTDSLFACGTRRAAKALAASGVPVYAYEFNDPNAPMALQPAVSFPFKSYHAAEIQYLFDLPSSALLSESQRALAEQMTTYWANFVKARNGNPNTAGSTSWPPYTTAEEMLLFAPTGTTVITNFKTTHRCAALWTPDLP